MAITDGILRTLGVAAFLVTCSSSALPGEDGDARRGNRLFFRAVGSQNNAPVLPKTRSAWTQDRREQTGNTGMADQGYTEYPFCFGRMDFTFVEHAAYYPRLLSGVQADEARVNTADLLLDHVYQPDGCVWGAEARAFAQTFTATRDELVSVTLLVASAPEVIEVSLHAGGTEGLRIGAVKRFVSGHSLQWGSAQWQPGEAPLVPGATYALQFRRADGRPWKPYLHSLGDAYAGGMLHIDGRPAPASDLAAWIVEQPEDMVRALVEHADSDGWSFDADSVWFRPRTPDVRMIWVNVTPLLMDPPTEHNCCDLVLRVWDASGNLVAGPKRSLSCKPPGQGHPAPFLFAEEEFKVTPGARYRLAVVPIPHKAPLPDDLDALARRFDMQARIYGDPAPGAGNAIHNLTVTSPERRRIRLEWSQVRPAATRIAIRGDGMEGVHPDEKLAHIDVPAGTSSAEIEVWPGHHYTFHLATTGPGGRTWRTPLYEVQLPRERTEGDPLMLGEHPPSPPELPRLAPPRVADARVQPPLRYLTEVPIANSGFENGLEGWMPAGDQALAAPDVGIGSSEALKNHGIGTRWGERIAGFSAIAGERREQVFAEATLTQTIATTPGHVYRVAAMAWTGIENGPRGDTRVRLVADPSGSGNFAHPNGTQWFWTDGEWQRFTHTFRAEGGRATIGAGFFRWRDLDLASAYVDEIHVYDLGAAPAEGDSAPKQAPLLPAIALTDHRSEADGRVEGFLAAPPDHVITGLGARAHHDNITTLWLQLRPLLADGSLGATEQLRGGWEPDSHLEAVVVLPDGWVATGFGAGIAPEWDVRRLGVWARELQPDGTLGAEERLFRGGSDHNSGFEKTVRVEAGRVLTSAGINCGFNDVNRVRATSARWTPTARFRAGHAKIR